MGRLRGFNRGNAPRGRNRRLTEWSLGPGDQTVNTFSASSLLILGLGAAANERLTVTRILGDLMFQLRTVVALGDGFQFTWGIGLVTSDAFAVGVTALPNPQDDMDWGGWLMHGFLPLIAPTATIGDSAGWQIVRIPIDVKAQRIMSPNEVLFMVVDILEIGTATGAATFDSRMLSKVH